MKKNYFNLSLITVVILCVFFSCKKEKVVESASFSLEERCFLAEDTTKGVLSIDMQVELPVKWMDEQILKKVRDSIVKNVFGERYIEISNDELLTRFAEDMKSEYKSNNLPFVQEEEPSFAFNNDYELETFALMNDDKIYVYGVNNYVYMGGAHGLMTSSFYNYDLTTGNVINQDDLFTQEGLKGLPLLMKNNIISSSEQINSIDELGEYYWVDDIAPNNNFYINTDGITFVFNPYEIAPYVVGRTEATFTFEELKPFLKENIIISYLIK